MYKTISEWEFRDEFKAYGREDQFSYTGLGALYDFYTDLENETGEQIELDVIAICCEWSEYGTIEEIVQDYENSVPDVNPNDYTDIDEYKDDFMFSLARNTTIIELDNYNGWLIYNY
jgi:hypothetical protein